MCGIAGIYFKKGVDESKLNTFKNLVKEKQAARGPDDFGSYQINEKLFFFHNRLSIIDLNASFQPIYDENGVLVYNGEIYNYQELNVDGKGFNSDTNYLLKALGKGNIEFLHDTNSMFGFCYFNKESRKLLLGRDRIGIKQVYYIENEEVFAFASTLAPLVPFSKKELNSSALPSFYLNRAFKAPNTIFNDVKLLEAGHTIEYDTLTNTLDKPKCFWHRDIIENQINDEENGMNS
jgi:asparagine synthase (glutamine-hydrolysing)